MGQKHLKTFLKKVEKCQLDIKTRWYLHCRVISPGPLSLFFKLFFILKNQWRNKAQSRPLPPGEKVPNPSRTFINFLFCSPLF